MKLTDVFNGTRSLLMFYNGTRSRLMFYNVVNFILCQGNLNFCSEKFLEPWYNLSSETEVMLIDIEWCRLCCFMGYSEIASWCVFPPYWRPWGDCLIYTDKTISKRFLVPRKSECMLWKIHGALIQFFERNWSYAMETRDVNTHLCGN
jgi:hypothetical protein